MQTGTNKSVEARFADILVEQYHIPREDIKEDALLVDMGLDSLCLVELSIDVEDEFEIQELTQEEVDGVSTVKDYIELIKKYHHG